MELPKKIIIWPIFNHYGCQSCIIHPYVINVQKMVKVIEKLPLWADFSKSDFSEAKPYKSFFFKLYSNPHQSTKKTPSIIYFLCSLFFKEDKKTANHPTANQTVYKTYSLHAKKQKWKFSSNWQLYGFSREYMRKIIFWFIV